MSIVHTYNKHTEKETKEAPITSYISWVTLGDFITKYMNISASEELVGIIINSNGITVKMKAKDRRTTK